MELKTVKIDKPDDLNMILGQTHFIKTVEDIHEALVSQVPGIKFSGPNFYNIAEFTMHYQFRNGTLI